MDVRVTSVSDEASAEILRTATLSLEKLLSAKLSSKDYGGGIQQIMIVVVSVDSDPTENARFSAAHNKRGSYTSLRTGSRISYLSIACPIDPVVVISSGDKLAQMILAKTNDDMLAFSKAPKGFDLLGFSKDLTNALGKN